MNPDLDLALERAVAALAELDDRGAAGRAELLAEIAAELEAAGEEIVSYAIEETSLTEQRLRGELERTCLQLRSYGEAAAAAELPVAAAAPPGLVRDSVAVGVVAVFGAGNFPLAFGALGTDTAAALAAGCPVVVKGHPGHPRTSARCVEAAAVALGRHRLDHALGLVQGAVEVGLALVAHPSVAAVAFTGSAVAGRALIDAAAARPDPIPVYAEMGSVNPILVTSRAAGARGEEIGAELAASVLGSAGQLCTKPGVLLIPTGPEGDGVLATMAAGIAGGEPQRLLNEAIAARLEARVGDLAAIAGIRAVARGPGAAALFELDADDPAAAAAAVAEEAFGPVAVAVRYAERGQALAVLGGLGGQLTVTIHGVPEDGADLAPVLAAARRQAGRIVWNGVPTGVAVAPAMHHGGPWPASNSLLGSVGPEALWRFRRPLAWQGFPPEIGPRVRFGFPGGELA